jgi:hypothetical protein
MFKSTNKLDMPKEKAEHSLVSRLRSAVESGNNENVKVSLEALLRGANDSKRDVILQDGVVAVIGSMVASVRDPAILSLLSDIIVSLVDGEASAKGKQAMADDIVSLFENTYH